MAQNAFTVTQANPTPPTNLSYVGNTPPLDPAQAFFDDGIPTAVPNSRDLSAANGASINSPAGALTAFAVKVAAANTAGAPGAGVSVDHEGRGAEVPLSVSSTLQSGATFTTTWVVLNPPAYSSNPNATHASSLSATVASTLTGVTGASNVSGTGTTSLTATGTLFNRSSVLYVNGIAQNTQYVSPTSLTVATASKKLTAGTLPCYVVTNGGVTSTVNWTLT
jgi:hypothetical protein